MKTFDTTRGFEIVEATGKDGEGRDTFRVWNMPDDQYKKHAAMFAADVAALPVGKRNEIAARLADVVDVVIE